MNEQQKILELIEKGQITAAEAMELLEAFNISKEPEQTEVTIPKTIGFYKYLKIKVSSDNNTVNVNVNIPIRLMTTIGEIATKMSSMIPNDARKEMENKGINFTSIDFSKIIEELLNGTLDDPNIVDVEVWDEEHKTMVKVKIYVE